MRHFGYFCSMSFSYYSLCQALRCVGDLIAGHTKNLNALATKVLGDGPQEAALNSLLRIILRTSSMQEFLAADYVFKSFCEVNNMFCLHFIVSHFCVLLNCISLNM